MNMKLYPILCGKLDSRRADLIDDERSRKDPEFRAEIPVSIYLIEHPEMGYILFDTGCDPDWDKENHWTDYRKKFAPLLNEDNKFAADHIRDLGIDPNEIETLVISHLHVDHAGAIHCFKNAKRVIVSEVELTTTMDHYENGGSLDAHEPSDIRNWIAYKPNWDVIPEDTDEIDLCDGIKIFNFRSGHAWGMLGLMIFLPNSGPHLLVSDAAYIRENMGPPVCCPSPELCVDPEGFRATLEYFNVLRDKYHAHVICGHDMEQFKQMQTKTYWD